LNSLDYSIQALKRRLLLSSVENGIMWERSDNYNTSNAGQNIIHVAAEGRQL